MSTLNKEYNITLRKADFAYAGVLLFIFALFTELFYRQTVRFGGAYNSDTYVYAQNLGNVEEIRLVAIIFSLLRKVSGGTFEIALFMGAVLVATIIAGGVLISLILKREGVCIDRWKIQAMSLAGVFSGAIYLPGIYEHFYTDTWSKYSWQSPTQQLMILFSIISMIMFLNVYDGYMEEMRFSRWIGLVISLFISVWAKPNFMLVLAPVAVVILIADLFTAKSYPVIHRLKRIIMLGTAFIPAGLYMIILSMQEAEGDSGGNGIEIRVGYFLRGIDMPVLMMILSMAFSLLVLAFNYRRLKERMYQLFAGMAAAGILEYMVLVEGGTRITHGNFSWGREVGEYLLFLAMMALAVKNYRDKEFLKDRPVLRKVYLIAAAVLFAAHVVSQVVYVQFIIRGHLYRM